MSDKLLTHLFDAEPPRNRRDEITATVVSLLGHVLLLALLIAIGGRKVASVVADLGVGDGIGIGLGITRKEVANEHTEIFIQLALGFGGDGIKDNG